MGSKKRKRKVAFNNFCTNTVVPLGQLFMLKFCKYSTLILYLPKLNMEMKILSIKILLHDNLFYSISFSNVLIIVSNVKQNSHLNMHTVYCKQNIQTYFMIDTIYEAECIRELLSTLIQII